MPSIRREPGLRAMTRARRCPFCDIYGDSLNAEVAHMMDVHSDIVAARQARAGYVAPVYNSDPMTQTKIEALWGVIGSPSGIAWDDPEAVATAAIRRIHAL